jgi:hypothetical protein
MRGLFAKECQYLHHAVLSFDDFLNHKMYSEKLDVRLW